MIKKINIKKQLITFFLIFIILTIQITNVTSLGLITDKNKKKQKGTDNITTNDSENNILFEKKSNTQDKKNYDKENKFNKLQIVINLIKLFFIDNPKIISICEQAHAILLKLPDPICAFLFIFVFYPLVSILYAFSYHPNYLLSFYAYFFIMLLELIYTAICDWPYYPTISELTTSNSINSDLIISSDVYPCPCSSK